MALLSAGLAYGLFLLDWAVGAPLATLAIRGALGTVSLACGATLLLSPRLTPHVAYVFPTATAALFAALGLVDPDHRVLALFALAANPLVNSLLYPEDRVLPLVIALVCGLAGMILLTFGGHGTGDLITWLGTVVAVASYGWYGTSRYRRLRALYDAEVRRELKDFTETLSAAAGALVHLRTDQEIADEVVRVLKTHGFHASVRPTAPDGLQPVGGPREHPPGLPEEGYGRIVEAPLLVDDQPCAVLRVEGPELNEATVSAIELFARNVGGALENVRHHQRAAQRLAELRALQKELVERERLAALGEAAAVVSHEVRNPLGAIVNATALLKRSARTEGDTAMISLIQEEASRLDVLVQDLLLLARPLEPRLQTLHLPELCEQVLGQARKLDAFAQLRLEVKIPEPTHVVADPTQLQLALQNLLRNAAQASPPGSTVRVSAERRDATVVIAVEDQGPGIREDDQAKIFEPFFTTRVAGTGLGLAIVKRVAQAHGGSIRVTTGEGQGARFELTLQAT